MNPKVWHPKLRPAWLMTLALGMLGASAVLAAYLRSNRWLDRARTHVDAGNPGRAERDLKGFLKLRPRNPEARLLLGLVFGHKRRWAEAVEQFRQVPDGTPETVEARWREGDASFMLNRMSDSEIALSKALEADPHHVESCRVLMHLYRWQDREAEARELLWRMFDYIPASQRHGFLAEWFRIQYAQFGQQEILERLRASLRERPDDANSAIALAYWSYRDKKLAVARDLLEQCIERRPDIVQGRSVLVACYLDLGEGDRARTLLQDWPEDRRDYRYWSLLGRWQQEYGRHYEWAATSLARALTDRPADWESRFRFAQCLARQGQHEESERQTAEAIRIREATSFDKVKELIDSALPALSVPSNRFRFGEFYEKIGCVREAQGWYESAAQITLDHAPGIPAISPAQASNEMQN